MQTTRPNVLPVFLYPENIFETFLYTLGFIRRGHNTPESKM